MNSNLHPRLPFEQSLNVRSPFLDTELVDYAARLPDSLKRRGLTTKWILREAFADWVPKEILHRPKMGFSIPLGAWFRGDLQSYLADMFAPGARMYGYLQERRVRALLAEHHAGRADHGSRIWLLLTLELWLRGFAPSAAGGDASVGASAAA